MAGVAVAGPRRVEPRAGALGLASGGHESDRDRVEHVVPAPKTGRPARGRLQEIAERRNRSVVQVRRAQPDAVERTRGVALRAAEPRELPRVTLAVLAVSGRSRRRPPL